MPGDQMTTPPSSQVPIPQYPNGDSYSVSDAAFKAAVENICDHRINQRFAGQRLVNEKEYTALRNERVRNYLIVGGATMVATIVGQTVVSRIRSGRRSTMKETVETTSR